MTASLPSKAPNVLGPVDRLRHVLIVGKTGMGKSTLLRALCREDAFAGRGMLLVDPHGDLAELVTADLPRRRRNDLVLFNATTPAPCPGLNPLRGATEVDRPLVASRILATMRKIWPEFWGPRTEHVLRHALLAAMEVRGATLADARMLLVDDKRRSAILRQVKDPLVRSFWAEEFLGYGKVLTFEVTAPVLNKLGALLASGTVREIVTKTRPRLDATIALARSQVVVAELPKGRIGEDATRLLGGLLLGAFQQAALGRANMPLADRAPFHILVDEVGSFATPPLIELIAEGRKFGVGLVLATQSLAALEPEARAALLGVETIVCFRVGADDAEILAREFVHEVDVPALMRLDIGEMVVRSGNARATTLRCAA